MADPHSDQLIPAPGAWTFRSQTVADGFDAHVREQLPWYEMATEAVAHIVRSCLPDHGTVYDVGASTGNIGRALATTIEARKAQLVAIEPSEEMVRAYDGPGRITRQDALRAEYRGADAIVSFLTMMFVPVPDRARLVAKWREALRPGGVIVVFDKISPVPGEIGTILYRLTLAGKLAAGAKPEAIIAKELSLSGVQRPIDPAVDLAGFEPVFRFGCFGGWAWIRT